MHIVHDIQPALYSNCPGVSGIAARLQAGSLAGQRAVVPACAESTTLHLLLAKLYRQGEAKSWLSSWPASFTFKLWTIKFQNFETYSSGHFNFTQQDS